MKKLFTLHLLLAALCIGAASLFTMPCSGMSYIKKVYWHEQFALLPVKKAQHNGWFLSEIKTAIKNKQLINNKKASRCFDLMLNCSGQAYKDATQKLNSLIAKYNQSLKQIPFNNAFHYKQVEKLNSFIKNYYESSVTKRKYFRQLQKDSYESPVQPYLKQPKFMIPALLTCAGIAIGGTLLIRKIFGFEKEEDITPLIRSTKKAIKPLPDCIDALNREGSNCVITHLTANQQRGDLSCGWQTALNAIGIKQELKQNGKISAYDLQQRTEKNLRELQVKSGNLPFNTFEPEANICLLAAENDLKDNFHVLHYRDGKVYISIGNADMDNPVLMRDPSHIEASNELLDPMLFQNTLQKMRTANEGEFYFACNLNNVHWTLLSVIKKLNTPTHIIYLDSSNANLAHNRSAQKYIRTIYNGLYHPERIQAEIYAEQAAILANRPLVGGSDFAKLPHDIQHLNFSGCVIKQIKSPLQDGLKYASRVLCNAVTIHKFLESDEHHVDADFVTNNSDKEFEQHPEIRLEQNPQAIMEHAEKLGLPNCIYLTNNNGTIESLHENKLKISFNEMINQLRTQEEATFYCWCKLPYDNNIDHAVLLALIKRRNKPFNMVYMDSFNQKIEDNPAAKELIKGVFKAIFPDYNMEPKPSFMDSFLGLFKIKSSILSNVEKNSIPLPDELKPYENKDCKIAQMNVVPQTGITCAINCIANAAAIRDMLAKNKQIDFAELQNQIPALVKEYGEQFVAYMKTKYKEDTGLDDNDDNPVTTYDAFLDVHHLRAFMKHLKLSACSTLGFDKENNVCVLDDAYCQDDQDGKTYRCPGYTSSGIDTITNTINNQENGELYLICHNGSNRYYLITIIKRAGLPLHILYGDSLNNQPLAENANAQKHIRTLCEKLFPKQ